MNLLGHKRRDGASADRHGRTGLARRMTNPDLTLGAVLVLLETREQQITAEQETVRAQIAELSAQLTEFEQEAASVTTTRQTLLALPDPEPAPATTPAPIPPDAPAYEQILAVLTRADGPLRVRSICEEVGVELTNSKISGANLHDSQALIPLVQGIPPIRSRRGRRRRRPGKLHADKGYDYDHLRRWLRGRGIRHRIARRGIESSTRLGRHRWTIERTMSWLANDADCTAATSAKPITSWPSPASPALSSATADSPNEMTS